MSRYDISPLHMLEALIMVGAGSLPSINFLTIWICPTMGSDFQPGGWGGITIDDEDVLLMSLVHLFLRLSLIVSTAIMGHFLFHRLSWRDTLFVSFLQSLLGRYFICKNEVKLVLNLCLMLIFWDDFQIFVYCWKIKNKDLTFFHSCGYQNATMIRKTCISNHLRFHRLKLAFTVTVNDLILVESIQYSVRLYAWWVSQGVSY